MDRRTSSGPKPMMPSSDATARCHLCPFLLYCFPYALLQLPTLRTYSFCWKVNIASATTFRGRCHLPGSPLAAQTGTANLEYNWYILTLTSYEYCDASASSQTRIFTQRVLLEPGRLLEGKTPEPLPGSQLHNYHSLIVMSCHQPPGKGSIGLNGSLRFPF